MKSTFGFIVWPWVVFLGITIYMYKYLHFPRIKRVIHCREVKVCKGMIKAKGNITAVDTA